MRAVGGVPRIRHVMRLCAAWRLCVNVGCHPLDVGITHSQLTGVTAAPPTKVLATGSTSIQTATRRLRLPGGIWFCTWCQCTDLDSC